MKVLLKKIKLWLMVLMILLLPLVLTGCTEDGTLIPELQEPLSYFLQQLIMILIIPLLSLFAAWLIAKVQAAFNKLKETSPNVAYWTDYVIRRVVLAAEQMNEKHPEIVADKKQWAIEQADAMLKNIGIVLNLDEIATLIEAEVKTLFNWKTEADQLPEPDGSD